jgi:hypothetical protein
MNDLRKVADIVRSCDKKEHAHTVPMWFRLWYYHSYVSPMLSEIYRLSPTLFCRDYEMSERVNMKKQTIREIKNNNPV